MTISSEILKQLLHAAVDAANPYRCVMRKCSKILSTYVAGGFTRFLVIGFGKASPAMARAVEESLGDMIDSGIIVTKYGHGNAGMPGKIRLFEAGHPIPDENGRKAAESASGRWWKAGTGNEVLLCARPVGHGRQRRR